MLAAYFFSLVTGLNHHHMNDSPVWLLSLLVVLTLIFGLWIWPSKSLIRGINEVRVHMKKVILGLYRNTDVHSIFQCKSKKILPWMASAGIHSLLLGVATINTHPVHPGLALFWVFLTAAQVLVWVAAFRIFRFEKLTFTSL